MPEGTGLWRNQQETETQRTGGPEDGSFLPAFSEGPHSVRGKGSQRTALPSWGPRHHEGQWVWPGAGERLCWMQRRWRVSW